MSKLKTPLSIEATPGPYEFLLLNRVDKSKCSGVVSIHTGEAVCWASGASDLQAIENAMMIARALNALHKVKLGE